MRDRLHCSGQASTIDPRSMKTLILPLVMGITGVGLIIGAVFFAVKSSELSAKGLRAVGTVTDVKRHEGRDSEGRQKVSYTSEVEFRAASGGSYAVKISGRNTIGDTVKLIYPTNSPEDAKKDSFASLWAGPIAAGIIGAVLLLIAVYLGKKAYNRKLEIDWLSAHGVRITARIVGINKDTVQHHRSSHSSRSRIGRRNYYTQTVYTILIEGTHPSTGSPLQFASHGLESDPGNQVVGSSIQVLVHPQDPSVYYVDVLSLGRG